MGALDAISIAASAVQRAPGSTSPTSSAQPAAAGPSFLERASEVLREADALQKDAEHQASELAAGRGSTVDTMVALSKADLSLRLVVSLRNRAVQAYEELMRMQV